MKRTLSLLLCAIMLLSCFAIGASAEENAIFNETGFPIFKEMQTVTVMFPRQPQHPTDFSDMWWVKVAREKFNINFEFILVEAVGWEEKKNLAFASDDLPDVFFHGITSNDENNYGPAGLLVNMAPYIEKYAPNIQNLLSQYDDVKKTFYFPDGSCYCLPTFNSSERDMVVNRTYINRAWCEKLGVKMPENLDEFYNYLVAVRDGDPNGNGQQDEIPFSGLASTTARAQASSGVGAQTGKQIILEACGLVDPYHDVIDGKYVYVPIHENYRYYLEYMNKLWEEKLLDPDYFTQTLAEMQAKYSENRIGASGSEVDVPTVSAAAGRDYHDYTGIRPLTSAVNDVPQVAAAFHYNRAWGTLAITHKCKCPEALVRFLDYCYTEEGSVMNRVGPEYGAWDGEGGYERATMEDGTPYFIPHYDGFTSYYEFRMTQSPMNVPYNSDTTLTNYTVNGDPLNMYISTCMYESGRLDARRFPFPNVALSQEEQDILLGFLDINSYADTMEAQFITGETELNDQTWNDYVNTIKNMGIDELAAVQQAAYDRWTSIK